MKYGYHGKILHIALNSMEFKEETPEDLLYRRYLGGSNMAAYYLLKSQKPNLDAFAPESPLIFFSGVMSGFNAPGLARFIICGKSPVTGGIGEARGEGPFACALKKTGYDGIIMTGACQKPSILLIDDGNPTLIPANDLWGKSISQCEKIIQQRFPDSDTAFIGIAGENKVRFANVASNATHQASRAGMGAVMGSKMLKGVIIRGGKLPEVYASKNIEETYNYFQQKMHKNVLSMWQHDRPGFGAWIHTHGIDAAVCVNNYQSATCDYLDEFVPEKFDEFYLGQAPCPHCPNNCIKIYGTKESDSVSGGLHQEALGALGPNLGNSNLSKIIECNVLCNDLGMDPNSLGYTISFAQECVQNGLLDAENLNLSFSSDVDLRELTIKIANRDGIGDLLAEGSYRAAIKIGKNAERFSMTVKKNELTPFEGRTQTNLALGFAIAAVGPRYEICEHDWDFDTNVGWAHSLDYCRTLGIIERIPMQYLGKKKVRYFKELNDLWAACDAIGMCLFATAPTRVYSLEDMSKLLHDITGFETSSYEIMRAGAMKNLLFRCYNCIEGFTSADDTLPERFFEEEIDAGSLKGSKLNKADFNEAIRFYYDMVGWDENGVPKESTLYKFDLEWLCEKLF